MIASKQLLMKGLEAMPLSDEKAASE